MPNLIGICPPAGLSPRVRGNLVTRCWVKKAVRSIPACAGEPPTSPSAYRLTWVYPRVCGGATELATKCGLDLSGLSPRVRGNPAPAGEPQDFDRSIPACAGEPS